MTTAKTQTLTI